MPGISGLETAQHLAVLDIPPAVVFTTAYDEYAMEAFDAQAVGYLLKPVRLERLRKALDHAARLSAAQLRKIAKADQEHAARRHIATRIGEQLRLVPVKEIILFRADQKYVSVIHRDGEHLIDESLKDLADEFSAQFVRIHRSILINAAQLESLDKDAHGKHVIRLRGYRDPLPVSRRQVSDVKRYMRGGDGKNLD
jgi:two-component system response regulator AlgR